MSRRFRKRGHRVVQKETNMKVKGMNGLALADLQKRKDKSQQTKGSKRKERRLGPRGEKKRKRRCI